MASNGDRSDVTDDSDVTDNDMNEDQLWEDVEKIRKKHGAKKQLKDFTDDDLDKIREQLYIHVEYLRDRLSDDEVEEMRASAERTLVQLVNERKERMKKLRKTSMASTSELPATRKPAPRTPSSRTPSSRKPAVVTVDSDEEELKERSVFKNYLPPVKGRLSLLTFGQSRKPPSHSRLLKGKWGTSEEEEFIVQTIKTGEGLWSEIKAQLGSLRSSVQLKDKWRIIPDSRKLSVAKTHGLTYKPKKKH
ncbi:uncharacterized protein LOC131944760 isoform X2 [Physella acuta]|uniref:uncharacterized protein LOC131944760 isoform X2 n=1 Tax=Physella acuta TaxID=109671 RepID=UPI0027DE1E6E|nr:uncharacterized protein LOC131944760 isoform X2 [Physella acuta]